MYTLNGSVRDSTLPSSRINFQQGQTSKKVSSQMQVVTDEWNNFYRYDWLMFDSEYLYKVK